MESSDKAVAEVASHEDPRRGPLELDIEGKRGPAPFRYLTIIMEHVIAAILVALIVSVSSNVVARSLLNNSLPWADELARMLFIWLIFIGAAAAFARYEHVAVDFIVQKASRRVAYTMYFTQHVIITVLMGFVLYGGGLILSRSTGTTAILGVPWNLINVSMLVCALFIAALAIWRAWQSLSLIRRRT
ncbi:TRAP transporter small permease [Aidingimonas halophila]|uniref:TRAP transporter small permease protein n=1 Tax=Aidingimonas halophila TaxID=574349 RepID=A0A1H2Y002_9GAMM|nr:TRAP transporter small permease [Aidingimonas halophila]GHC34224.1 hypothetical protein GCM10008094_28940 [Aidingimonas halophila]SDW98532.1 TRAP-type C4-dicarboxylate transport system, small permease component [Aidingimonas halophila]